MMIMMMLVMMMITVIRPTMTMVVKMIIMDF